MSRVWVEFWVKFNFINYFYIIIIISAHTKNMKKTFILLILLFVIFISSTNFTPYYKVFNANTQQPIKTVFVANGNNKGIASLFGNGQNYITNAILKVEFENFPSYEIKLQDGYSPNIEVLDFGAEDKFLFYSSQTGGSGGYGNYYIYYLKTTSYQLLYDNTTNSKAETFTANFEPNGFMNIINNQTQNSLLVYVGYMDKTYYNKIFDANGQVKEQQPYVNDISFVSPALNSSNGIWRLITYRSITAVAEVNRLGYIVQTLNYNSNGFSPSFTEFAINF